MTNNHERDNSSYCRKMCPEPERQRFVLDKFLTHTVTWTCSLFHKSSYISQALWHKSGHSCTIFQSVGAQHNSSLRVWRPAYGETVLSFSCGTGAKPPPRYEKSEIMPEDCEVPCETVSSWIKCPIFNHCLCGATKIRHGHLVQPELSMDQASQGNEISIYASLIMRWVGK